MEGVGLYDYGARMYDAAIGRFTTVDPLSEAFYPINPYVYAGNNPISNIDPSGMSFFKSKFLNGNGGHWTDKIGIMSASDRADKDHKQGEYSETQRSKINPYIIQHKRRKGETRSSIAKKHGIDKKYVGTTKGTPRGTLIPYIDVDALMAVYYTLAKKVIKYKNPVTGKTAPTNASETTYGLFVNTMIFEIINQGLYSKDNPDGSTQAIQVAGGNWTPLGVDSRLLSDDGMNFRNMNFSSRAALWDIGKNLDGPWHKKSLVHDAANFYEDYRQRLRYNKFFNP